LQEIEVEWEMFKWNELAEREFTPTAHGLPEPPYELVVPSNPGLPQPVPWVFHAAVAGLVGILVGRVLRLFTRKLS
jgi:hypothetical protein